MTSPADVLLALEARILAAKERRRELQAEIARVDGERVRLAAEVEAQRRTLAALRGAPDWGDLRRLRPVSDVWGTDRGTPVDRHYIARFLDAHRLDVRGRVLEVKDAGYTRRFGEGRVTRSDVVDVDPTNTRATFHADLAQGDGIPEAAFDCVVLTQLLNIVPDPRAVLGQVARVLKPGGVLLCTASSVNRISYEDQGLEGDFWRFTAASFRLMMAEAFPGGATEVRTYGNVLACAAFLFGLAAEDLTPGELGHDDPWFPLVCCARVVKASP